MKQNKNYHLTEEKRTQLYTEFMTNALYEYSKQILEQTIELFYSQRNYFENSFYHMAEKMTRYLQSGISSGIKGKICYVHFSYLLSGALSDEMLVKMDCYDKCYYADIADFDCFWNCKKLFPQYDIEKNKIEKNLQREVIRTKSGEISQVGICLTACNYLILKPIVSELVRGERFQNLINSYCAQKTFFLYGAYLDQAEVVYQFWKE